MRIVSVLGRLGLIKPYWGVLEADTVHFHLSEGNLKLFKLLILWKRALEQDAAGSEDFVVNASSVVNVQVSHELLVIVPSVCGPVFW